MPNETWTNVFEPSFKRHPFCGKTSERNVRCVSVVLLDGGQPRTDFCLTEAQATFSPHPRANPVSPLYLLTPISTSVFASHFSRVTIVSRNATRRFSYPCGKASTAQVARGRPQRERKVRGDRSVRCVLERNERTGEGETRGQTHCRLLRLVVGSRA